MINSRKKPYKNYKEKTSLTIVSRVIFPLSVIMISFLIFFSVKLFFDSNDKSLSVEYDVEKFNDALFDASYDYNASDDFLTDKKNNSRNKIQIMWSSNNKKKVVLQKKNKTEKNVHVVKAKNNIGTDQKSVRTDKKIINNQTINSIAQTDTNWIVQIGGFAAKDGAKYTVNEVKKAGYNAYIFNSELNGKPFYKVRIKCGKNRDSVTQTAEKLKKLGYPIYIVNSQK